MEALQSEGTVSQLWVYHTPPLVPCTISAHAETTVSPEDIAGWLHPGKYWFGIFPRLLNPQIIKSQTFLLYSITLQELKITLLDSSTEINK